MDAGTKGKGADLAGDTVTHGPGGCGASDSALAKRADPTASQEPASRTSLGADAVSRAAAGLLGQSAALSNTEMVFGDEGEVWGSGVATSGKLSPLKSATAPTAADEP